MNFTEDYILENDAVLLRPLRESDFSNLIHFSLKEPELWTYSLQRGDGADHLREYIGSALQSRIDQHAYPFIVFDKKQNCYAGSTRFYDIQPSHETLQLGFTWYGKVHQRTGLNRNCKYLMLDFAFSKLNVARVEFRADANNERSIQAMKKLGCTVEGILRSNCKAPEGRRDSIILSILKDEWIGKLKSQLKSKIQSK